MLHCVTSDCYLVLSRSLDSATSLTAKTMRLVSARRCKRLTGTPSRQDWRNPIPLSVPDGLERIIMRENLHIPPKPDLGSTQSIMDYTTVHGGLCIKGKMWTGQVTTFTERCPKCGRIGVGSATQNDKRIIVHRGRVAGDMLEGIDYCEFVSSTTLPPRPDRRI